MIGIDLVVACTNRKRTAVPSELAFGSLPQGTAETVATEWMKRTQQADNRWRTEELYAGPGWASVLRAQRMVPACRLHVLSAGFGLVAGDTTVPPYSATFAAHPDQVAKRISGPSSTVEAHQQWWAAINQVRGNGALALTRQFTSSERVVLAMGAEYLEAALHDLATLAGRLRSSRLIIVSAGAQPQRLPAEVAECILPGGVELQLIENVPRSRLNYWGAEWVVSLAREIGWDPARIATRTQETIVGRRKRGATLPGVGARQTDEQVQAWIRKALLADPRATRLHRRFRDEGFACEQKRFKLLLEQVKLEGTEAN